MPGPTDWYIPAIEMARRRHGGLRSESIAPRMRWLAMSAPTEPIRKHHGKLPCGSLGGSEPQILVPLRNTALDEAPERSHIGNLNAGGSARSASFVSGRCAKV